MNNFLIAIIYVYINVMIFGVLAPILISSPNMVSVICGTILIIVSAIYNIEIVKKYGKINQLKKTFQNE